MKGLVHLRNVRENKITVHVIHKELRVKYAEGNCQVSWLDLHLFSEGRVAHQQIFTENALLTACIMVHLRSIVNVISTAAALKCD